MLEIRSTDNDGVLRSYGLPALVLCVGLVLTHVAYAYVKKQQSAMQLSSFDRMADNMTGRLDAVMRQHEDLLVGVRGLFVASAEVTRSEFHYYTESVDLAGRFPAVYGLGWNPKVLNDDVERFEQWVRDDTSIHPEGYPDFQITPASDNPERYPLTFFAPYQRVQFAQGMDLGASEARRTAIFTARDTGLFAASPPIKLIGLKGDKGDPAGFVIALAVYENWEPQNIKRCCEKLLGVITAAFQVKALLDAAGVNRFDGVRLFDVTNAMENAELQPFYSIGEIDESFEYLVREFQMAGREWRVYLYQSPITLHGWIDLSTVPIVVALGLLVSVVSAVLVHVLVTSRNRAMSLAHTLNADLTRVNADLSRSNHDLGQFAYIASHDLQTPVRNVQSSIMLLENALEHTEDPSITRYLQYLHESASRMQNLVGDLLFHARAERTEPELVETYLDELFDRTIGRLDNIIDENHATIDVQGLPVIMGNAEQLERLFSNLLVNAMKYRHADRLPHIKVYAEAWASEWAIHICDNGLGIEKRHRERVFEPFSRLHRHDEIEGTGLGLSICKEIIGSHGGTVQLTSKVGEGAVFTLYFPAMQSVKSKAA